MQLKRMFAAVILCGLMTMIAENVLCEEINVTESLIEQTVPDFVPLLLSVACNEIGYQEGENNYSKYGEWSGDPNAQWCAEFVCWCVNRCDELYGTELLKNVYPLWSGQNTGRDWFIARGRFAYRKGNCPDWGYQWETGSDHYLSKNEFIPCAGDLVYFSYTSYGDTSHVALIEYVARSADGTVNLHVIEGNNPDRVQRAVYPLSSSQVLGFGLCSDRVDTVMRSGCEGDKVLELQQMLSKLGYLEESDCSGVFRSATKAAVAAFQTDYLPKRNYYGIADRLTVETIRQIVLDPVSSENDCEQWLVEEE